MQRIFAYILTLLLTLAFATQPLYAQQAEEEKTVTLNLPDLKSFKTPEVKLNVPFDVNEDEPLPGYVEERLYEELGEYIYEKENKQEKQNRKTKEAEQPELEEEEQSGIDPATKEGIIKSVTGLVERFDHLLEIDLQSMGLTQYHIGGFSFNLVGGLDPFEVKGADLTAPPASLKLIGSFVPLHNFKRSHQPFKYAMALEMGLSNRILFYSADDDNILDKVFTIKNKVYTGAHLGTSLYLQNVKLYANVSVLYADASPITELVTPQFSFGLNYTPRLLQKEVKFKQ